MIPNTASHISNELCIPLTNASDGIPAITDAPNIPPRIATRSPKMTSSGNINTPANTLGVIKNEIGSNANASSASICSVTRIVPSSAVMVAPTFPANTSAVNNGVNSNKTDLVTSAPTTERGIQS